MSAHTINMKHFPIFHVYLYIYVHICVYSASLEWLSLARTILAETLPSKTEKVFALHDLQKWS